MSHIVTLQTDPSDSDVIYLGTSPEMSSVMGGFGPARYIRNAPIKGASYVIEADDLPRFTVYCANRSVRIVDRRETQAEPERRRPAWAERPLPECRECGQPARRGYSPAHCPNCGAVWDAVEIGAPGSAGNRVEVEVCAECGRDTPVGWSHCTECGARRAER